MNFWNLDDTKVFHKIRESPIIYSWCDNTQNMYELPKLFWNIGSPMYKGDSLILWNTFVSSKFQKFIFQSDLGVQILGYLQSTIVQGNFYEVFRSKSLNGKKCWLVTFEILKNNFNRSLKYTAALRGLFSHLDDQNIVEKHHWGICVWSSSFFFWICN